jgi:hypothetical protein
MSAGPRNKGCLLSRGFALVEARTFTVEDQRVLPSLVAHPNSHSMEIFDAMIPEAYFVEVQMQNHFMIGIVA